MKRDSVRGCVRQNLLLSVVPCLTNAVMKDLASATEAKTRFIVTDMIQWWYAEDLGKTLGKHFGLKLGGT